MTTGDFLRLPVLAGIGLVALVTGALAGAYPALFLSSFDPGAVLKAGPGSGAASGGLFRKVLVLFQFALSGALIVGTIVIFGQVRYMKTKSLGFDREHLVYVRLGGNPAQRHRGRQTGAPSHPRRPARRQPRPIRRSASTTTAKAGTGKAATRTSIPW
ncbi:MAG: hypothetical protein M0C28_03895 [Candidatus Moduliflexus flocculans]|nr:hypothetical protein [Candidatus Moduliflexus flocculans]